MKVWKQDVPTDDEPDILEEWILFRKEKESQMVGRWRPICETRTVDVCNPKRKKAWSGANMETIFVSLPAKKKGQRNLVARDLFNKCGESTNFTRSYSGVPFRNLAETPRLTSEKKAFILGKSAVGDFNKSPVQQEVTQKGHPLM